MIGRGESCWQYLRSESMKMLPSIFKETFSSSPRQQLPLTAHLNKLRARFGSTVSVAFITVRFMLASCLSNASCSRYTLQWLHPSFTEVALTCPYSTRKITVYVRINYTASIKFFPVVIGATVKIKKLGLLLIPLCSYPR